MEHVFAGATIFNNGEASGASTKPLNFDTTNVTTMANMFENADAFNQDIGGWNVSNVTNMSFMFAGNFVNPTIFNQNISGWDVSQVTDMEAMFQNDTSFNQDLSVWNINVALKTGSEPTNFSINTTSWVLPKPNWTPLIKPLTKFQIRNSFLPSHSSLLSLIFKY